MIKELKQRDLSEVSTEKLIELALKVYGELKAEYLEPKPLAEGDIIELKALRLSEPEET